MTPDGLIPKFLKDEQDRVEAEQAERRAIANQQASDEFLISNQWATMWKQLSEKLHLAVDSFPALPALKLNGKFSSFAPSQVRVDMHGIGGHRLSGTHTDLYCDGRTIGCTTLDSPGTPMDAEQASAYIIGRMMAVIKRQAG